MNNVKKITLISIIATLYSVLVIILIPISFGIIQLRVADVLIPLSAILGLPVVYGVTLGTFIANAYFFLSPIDVVFGTVASFLSSYIIYKMRNKKIGCVLGSVVLGIIVGGYLWLFFPVELLGMPLWITTVLSITLSSLITVTGIGYPLMKIIERCLC